MNYLMYVRQTQETGKKLAEELGISHGIEPPADRVTTLIRWGNGGQVRFSPTTTINTKDAVLKAINKMGASNIFRDRGVRTPSILTSITVPCIGRTVEHTQGQNMWLCWENQQVESARREGAEYFIPYIPVKQEWRVHVIDGDVAFVQRKYDVDRVSTAFMGVQGFRDRWHQSKHNPEVAGFNVCMQALRSVESLGLSFGGVDVIVGLQDNLPYVLEVNTGPALPTPETREPYLTFFRRRIAG